MSRPHSLSLLALLVATSAGATSNYPGTIKNTLELQRVPQCTLCHATNAGGAGTSNSPFSLSLQAAGLTGGGDLDGLNAALAKLEMDGTDSDMDGVADITELRNGTNPNVADAPMDGGTLEDGGTPPVPDAGVTPEPPPEIPEPSYGCSQSGSGLLGALMGLVALALFAIRRRSAI